MTDIVERLRQWAGFGYGVEASAAMREAADEIERLRTTLISNEKEAAKFAECVTDEITRLRAALAGVVREWEEYRSDGWDGDVPFVVGLTMAGIARAALQQEPKP